MPLKASITSGAGLDSSKGDEVIRSLSKLLDKIHRLEANRRVSRDKSADVKDHIALVEAQCALLQEQLGYARRMLAFSSNLRAPPSSCTEITETRELGCAERNVHAANGRISRVPEARRVRQPAKVGRSRSTSDVPPTHDNFKPAQACKINIASIPFILSKSTAPSHSLPANLQNVVSLLKKSNPEIRKGPPRLVHSDHLIRSNRELLGASHKNHPCQEDLAKLVS